MFRNKLKRVSPKHRAYISRREPLSLMGRGTTGLPDGIAGAPGNQLDFHNVSVGGFLTLVNWVYVAGPSERRRIKTAYSFDLLCKGCVNPRDSDGPVG